MWFLVAALVWVLVAALISLVGARDAEAQGANCYSHGMVVTRRAERFGETRVGVGLAANGAMLEVFASDETGTWTIAVTSPGGATCLVASGTDWQRVRTPLPEPGIDG